MKRLYKSRKNKVIDGVCGGIAEYFDVDPVLVRVVFVLFFFLGGSAIIAYIVGMIIMPRAPYEPAQEKETKTEKEEKVSEPPAPKPAPASASPGVGSLIIGILLIIIGGFFLLDNFNFPFFHRFFWWFKYHFWEFLIPGILIILGLVLIVKSSEK
ncbi:MAG: PspC domain-containing protein [Candidatus Aminicenantes bacterium]|nr:MAG: PspC domain-containing protein [Candidatus Aminicenantes bacterium]